MLYIRCACTYSHYRSSLTCNTFLNLSLSCDCFQSLSRILVGYRFSYHLLKGEKRAKSHVLKKDVTILHEVAIPYVLLFPISKLPFKYIRNFLVGILCMNGKKNMYAINWAHNNKFDNHLHISMCFVFFFGGIFWHFLEYLLALLFVQTLAKFTPEKCKNMKCFMMFTKEKMNSETNTWWANLKMWETCETKWNLHHRSLV